MVNHQGDITQVEYPGSEDLPRTAPGDAGEVFDVVVRKGPISHDRMMRDQISMMSSDEVFESLLALEGEGYVSRVEGDLDEHGTTRDVWYVPDGE